MKFSYLAAVMLAFALPAMAHAAGTATFTGVCNNGNATTTKAKCTSVAGATGAVTIAATDDATLKVMITAWQANQSTNAVISAALGAYDGGFGVTGVNDQSGANNLHQIDNAGGYTDFIMLQFSRAVQLTSASLNVYGIGGGTDSDLSVLNLGALIGQPAQWNAAINLSTLGSNDTSLWTQQEGTGARTATFSSLAFSQVWLISAAQLPTNDRDDGFKLSQIVVKATPAVPEPATWAMLMVGFGAIGASLRRRKTVARGEALIA